MTKYKLAKVIQWAGRFDTRKRMQKVVYLLQAAGCPFEADYFLHRFGPYSQEVAQLTEQLVESNILAEVQTENSAGYQFGYQLTDEGSNLLCMFESSSQGQRLAQGMASFEPLTKMLVGHGLRELEVASTIAYFFTFEHDWTKAKLSGCRFKNVPSDSTFASRVEALAKSIVE